MTEPVYRVHPSNTWEEQSDWSSVFHVSRMKRSWALLSALYRQLEKPGFENQLRYWFTQPQTIYGSRKNNLLILHYSKLNCHSKTLSHLFLCLSYNCSGLGFFYCKDKSIYELTTMLNFLSKNVINSWHTCQSLWGLFILHH